MSEPAQTAVASLRHNLNSHFDLDELNSLCFDLGIDPEQLPVQSRRKDELVRELIREVARQGRLEALIASCRESRPQVEWQLPEETAISAWLEMLAAPPVAGRDRRNQLMLLEKVRRFWIDGVLERSVAETSLVEVKQQPYSEAIDHPWHEVVGAAVYDSQSLAVHETILETFSETEQALLILGDAGSGKTTTLLALARELIGVAEKETAAPVPVVLSLASWSEKRAAIADWVTEELNTKYQIPGQMTRDWLAEDALLLLLDSLDEVPWRYRDDCIAAINQFRQQQGLTGLAICCRTDAYQAVGVKLRLGGAILLQTLSAEQLDAFLEAAGPRLSTLRRALQHDGALREMALSPLMLNVMARTYGDEPDGKDQGALPELDVIGDPEKLRRGLFAAYVQRTFQRGGAQLFRQEKTLEWLVWLAGKMSLHNQALFLIELLQPSWLPGRGWRWLYAFVTRLSDGFFIGLLLWLYLANKQGVSQFVDAFTDISQRLGLAGVLADLWPVVAINLILGVVAGGIDAIRFEGLRGGDRLSSEHKPGAKGWQEAAVKGLVVGLLSLAAVAILGHPFEAISWGALEGAMFFLSSLLLHGSSFRDDMRTVEKLSWSWPNAVKAGAAGLLVGVISGVIGWRVYDTMAGMRAAPGWALLLALLLGLSGRKVEEKSSPNQGVWLSAGNGLLAAALFGLTFSLFAGFLFGSVKAGLSAGFTVALGSWLTYGGNNFIKHFLVRIILVAKGLLPWRCSHFLDYAVERAFMHRVGGGYIFIHRLLQEFLAQEASS